MKRLTEFIETTVMGGALFLVPIVIVLAIVEKAHEMTTAMVTPLITLAHVEALFSPIAIGLLAVVIIVAVCFAAGLYAKTPQAKRALKWLEDVVLIHVPGYSYVRSVTGSLSGIEAHKHQLVLARLDDTWQIAFLVERLDAGYLAVYVPGAPSTTSGSVYFMTEDRVRPLDVPSQMAIRCVHQFGEGSAALLAGKLEMAAVSPAAAQ